MQRNRKFSMLLILFYYFYYLASLTAQSNLVHVIVVNNISKHNLGKERALIG